MKRIICILMVLTLSLGLLVGCGGGKKPADSSSTDSVAGTTAIVITTDDVKYIAEDGSSVYRIVRPEGNTVVTPEAGNLFKNMKSGLDIGIKNVSDTEDGTDVYEILVGNTNRPESQAAIDYLYDNGMGRYQDYIICTMGKKIVINAITDEAVANAVNYFIDNFIKKEGIAGGIKYTCATPGEFGSMTINGANIGEFTIIRDKSSRSWLLQEEYRKVQDKIREKTGYLLPLREDKDTAEKEYEIHIGNTIRTAKPQSGYDYDSWEIAIADKKVYLAGGSTYAVQVALTEFGKMLEKGAVTNANSKTGSYAATVATYDTSEYYTLTWQEEFDYEAMSIEASGWTIDPISVNNDVKYTDDGEPYRRFGTAFLVTDADTSAVTNGNFIMRAIKMEDATITYPASQGGGTDGLLYKHQGGYHSASVMTFNFGYVEMRARIPDGTGVYSSFWINGLGGEAGSLEVDIFESLGMAHTLRANIHYWGGSAPDGHTSLDSGLFGKGVHAVDGKDRQYVLPKSEGTLFDDYHTIGCYWSWDGIRFYCDGVMYYEDQVDEFHVDKYMEIIGGVNVGWGTRITPAVDVQFPLEYHVDYFRLYQVDGQGLRINK